MNMVNYKSKIEYYLKFCEKEIIEFHQENLYLFNKAKGSQYKHQNWEGGYRNHLEQCLNIGHFLYKKFKKNFNFSFESVVKVLYFHDIEKMWKYNNIDNFNKKEFLNKILPKKYNIRFSINEKNALKYIHGEPDCEYNNKKRIMNRLAGFCHACDILSARTFYDLKDLRI